jgi:hypothetical protein
LLQLFLCSSLVHFPCFSFSFLVLFPPVPLFYSSLICLCSSISSNFLFVGMAQLYTFLTDSVFSLLLISVFFLQLLLLIRFYFSTNYYFHCYTKEHLIPQLLAAQHYNVHALFSTINY